MLTRSDVLDLSDRFIAPDGSNRAQVEVAIQSVVRTVLDFSCSATASPPMPSGTPRLPDVSVPSQGRSIVDLSVEIGEMLAQSMNAASPRYIGHMDTVPCLAGQLGEFVSAAINNNMLSVELSPLFSRLEHSLLVEICQLFGWGETAGGVMLSGGSLANLQALAVARNLVLECQEPGLLAHGRRAVVLASSVAHTSMAKACMLLGLGSGAVVSVDVDGQSRMRVDDLERKIVSARHSGATTLCVVATAGTTTTGSVDPIDAIADVCVRHDLWLHVDAAYGGALIFSARHRSLLDGIARADSITFNPQKWLYVPKTCAMVLFKDQAQWHSAFRVSLPYMGEAGPLVNQAEVSVQGTRHAEVIKLWLSLQHLGSDTLASLIDRSIDLASDLEALLRQRPSIEVLGQAQTNIVCFRVRDDQDSARRDTLTEGLQQDLRHRGVAFTSLPTYAGGKAIRAVLLNPYTDDDVLRDVLRHIDEYLAGINDRRRPDTTVRTNDRA